MSPRKGIPRSLVRGRRRSWLVALICVTLLTGTGVMVGGLAQAKPPPLPVEPPSEPEVPDTVSCDLLCWIMRSIPVVCEVVDCNPADWVNNCGAGGGVGYINDSGSISVWVSGSGSCDRDTSISATATLVFKCVNELAQDSDGCAACPYVELSTAENPVSAQSGCYYARTEGNFGGSPPSDVHASTAYVFLVPLVPIG